MLLVCFEGIARLSRRVWRRFVRGSRENSLVPSLHRASTDALIGATAGTILLSICAIGLLCVKVFCSGSSSKNTGKRFLTGVDNLLV